MRQILIENALRNRLSELCRTRVLRLVPARYENERQFVAQLREQLVTSPLESLGVPMSSASASIAWVKTEVSCLSSLQALSLGHSLPLSEAGHPLVGHFSEDLDRHKRDPVRRFQLLIERYACPLNFMLPAEDAVREYVLTRLMVQDRAQIEARSVNDIDEDDLLLKLNLVAVHALGSDDLRFLDALNYYYELLPTDWVPCARHGWLVPSYLGLYARALAIQISGNQTVAHRHTCQQSARSLADL
jgi:hypothetical protein